MNMEKKMKNKMMIFSALVCTFAAESLWSDSKNKTVSTVQVNKISCLKKNDNVGEIGYEALIKDAKAHEEATSIFVKKVMEVLERCGTSTKTHKEEICKLQKENEKLKQSVQIARKETLAAQEQLQKVRTQNGHTESEFRKTITAKDNEIAKLKQQIENIKTDLSELMKQLGNLGTSEETSTTTTEIKITNNQILKLQVLIKKTMKELKLKKQKLEIELQALISSNGLMDKPNLRSLIELHNVQSVKIKELVEKMAEREEAIKEKMTKEKEAVIASYKQEMRGLEVRGNALQKKIEELTIEIKQYEEKEQILNQTINANNEKIRGLETAKEANAAELEKLRKENAYLSEKRIKYKTLLTKIKTSFKILKAAQEGCQEQLKKLKSFISTSDKIDLTKLRKAVDKLTNVFKAAGESLNADSFTIMNQDLNATLQEIEKEAAKAEEERP